MKNKITKIFTIFASIIYFLAIFYLIFNLTNEYKNGNDRTKLRFDTCIQNLRNDLKVSSSSNQIENIINNDIGNLKDFSFIEFFENGKTIYFFEATPNAKENQSKLIKSYFASFKIEDKNYFLTANLYKLKPSSIYYYVKVAFLIILIITIITISFIFFLNNKMNSKMIINTDSSDSENETEENVISEDSETENSITNEESNNLNNTSEEEKKEIEIENVIEESSEEKTENASDENPNLELPNSNVIPVDITDKVQGSETLFSPSSGLGFENHLLTRLDSELNRAISSEFDLSLFVIKISNLSRESETVKKVCSFLINSFQFRDLLFEYKQDCIVAIKINMNIDEAITFADSLNAEIKKILVDSFAKCHIGISARSLRMISGERLLKEADEALIHALKSNENIIGFRADAEKFRKFFEK